MSRTLGILANLAVLTTQGGCSLLFDSSAAGADGGVSDAGDVPVSDFTSPLIVRIGAGGNNHFPTLAQWYKHRTSAPDPAKPDDPVSGSLKDQQILRVVGPQSSLVNGQHFTGQCSGVVRGLSLDRDVTDVMILDLDNIGNPCEVNDEIFGVDDAGQDLSYKIEEVLPPGVSEVLQFTTSPVLGPLELLNNLGTNDRSTLTLEAAIAHNGFPESPTNITIRNEGTSNYAIRIASDYTTIQGFEIEQWRDDDSGTRYAAVEIEGDFVTLDSLLIHGNLEVSDGPVNDGIAIGFEAEGTKIRNSILFSLTGFGIHYFRGGVGHEVDGPADEAPVVSNCTLHGCVLADGASQNGLFGCVSTSRDTFTIVNTLALVGGSQGDTRQAFSQERSNAASFVGDINTGYNRSDDQTSPGVPSGSIVTGDFEDPVVGDFHLRPDREMLTTQARCLNRATDTDARTIRDIFSHDIDGDERAENRAWSIGADQTDVGQADCISHSNN